MSLIIAGDEKSGTIPISTGEAGKLGFKNGEEAEFIKNGNDEIISRSKQSARNRKILGATREIIENRKSALIELGKGHE